MNVRIHMHILTYIYSTVHRTVSSTQGPERQVHYNRVMREELPLQFSLELLFITSFNSFNKGLTITIKFLLPVDCYTCIVD